MKLSGLFAILAGALALFVIGWVIASMWSDLGVHLSVHGWIAYGLGAAGSLALSGVLFWLLFHSSRAGHDDIERLEDLDT